MDNTELIQKTALFKSCSKEDIELVSGLFQERQVKSNATVFTENMQAEALYIIKEGSVRISIMAGEGEERALLTLGPGDFFGELALLMEEGRLVTARADTDASLLLLTRKEFQALTDLDPKAALRIAMAITRLLTMRIKAYSSRLKDMLLE